VTSRSRRPCIFRASSSVATAEVDDFDGSASASAKRTQYSRRALFSAAAFRRRVAEKPPATLRRPSRR